MTNIAAILTVFNRREKTLSCLRHLFRAVEAYNLQDDRHDDVRVSVFLTDDGCTDGTADAIRRDFPQQDIHIIQGTGSLFWAGGMRLAWQSAIDSGTLWDYFLLLNDDTNIRENALATLFEADDYGFHETGKHGLSSGITCDTADPNKVTYGGFNYLSRWRLKATIALPTGKPQHADLTHANILLMHHSVVDAIGTFHKGYLHGSADFDYALTAARHGLPTLVTGSVCGQCPYDHFSNEDEIHRLCHMTLRERKQYFNSPTRSDHDFLLFVRRNAPWRFPVTLTMRKLRLYLPWLYYGLNRLRGLYATKEKK